MNWIRLPDLRPVKLRGSESFSPGNQVNGIPDGSARALNGTGRHHFRPPTIRPSLGIPSMEAGIVGLPNVGKSTLFNALTKAGALAANYPFATIEPNVGVVPIPDPRLQRITKYIPPQKTIPAALRLVDIAGIVKGASVGEGLGNKFLSHIREVDAVMQVVRCFMKRAGRRRHHPRFGVGGSDPGYRDHRD